MPKKVVAVVIAVIIVPNVITQIIHELWTFEILLVVEKLDFSQGVLTDSAVCFNTFRISYRLPSQLLPLSCCAKLLRDAFQTSQRTV